MKDKTLTEILYNVLPMYYLLSTIHGHLDPLIQLILPKMVII